MEGEGLNSKALNEALIKEDEVFHILLLTFLN